MAPRNFSEDGASGATQGVGGSIPGVTMNDPGPGASVPGVTVNDPGPSPGSNFSNALAMPGVGSSAGQFDPGGLVRSTPAPSAPSFGSGYGGFSSPAPSQSSPGGVPALGNGYGPVSSAPSTPSFSRAGGNTWSGAGGGNDVGLMFEDGGLVPDVNGGDFMDRLNAALTAVDDAISYGRQKHGIGGQQMAMNDQGFRKSDNIEDRRDTPGMQGEPGSNFRTNADRVGDKINDWQAGRNPASQALGINDVPPMAIPHPGDGGVGSQGPGPQGSQSQDQDHDQDDEETA